MNDIEQLQESFKDHALDDERHFRELGAMIQNLEKKIDTQTELLKPVLEAYDGILFSKKFIVGTASVVLAIAAIGGGVIWLIGTAVKH